MFLGPLHAQAQAALAGASSAVITPGLPALAAQLACPPPEADAAATAEYAALIASERLLQGFPPDGLCNSLLPLLFSCVMCFSSILK